MYLTYRKTIAIGGTVAAIVGVGGTALATSGDTTTAGSGTAATAKPAKDGKHAKHSPLRRLEHGQFVVRGKQGTITRTVWRGDVTSVSPTSITVQAADKKSQTYVVGKDTAVAQRAKGAKPAKSSIDKIAKGDRVVVTGTGTSTVTAQRIVELPK